LKKVREEVKDINFLDLRDGLLKFVDGRRAYLKRRLQYFVNMILLPHLGYGKEKVRIIFESCWLETRDFTVNVKPKERRGFLNNSGYFLRSIQEATEEISNTLLEVSDFAKAFSNIKVKDEDYHLVFPMITKVVDTVNSVKDGKE
jgi:hypothetical protein